MSVNISKGEADERAGMKSAELAIRTEEATERG